MISKPGSYWEIPSHLAMPGQRILVIRIHEPVTWAADMQEAELPKLYMPRECEVRRYRDEPETVHRCSDHFLRVRWQD